jgi:rubrerythrin
MFTMDDLLEIAIKMEENAEAIYNQAIKNVRQKELKDLLRWMANEEIDHCQWFADQKNKAPIERDEVHLKEMVPQALQDMMGEKTLSLEDINFSKVTKTATLLETFINFENETILFYELLEMFILEEPVLTGLKQIILEEKNHIKTLKSMMLSLPEE